MKRRRVAVLLLAGLVLAGGGVAAGRVFMPGVAMLLVVEDPLEPADVIVVSNASIRAGALEAARLYGLGMSGAVVLPAWHEDRVDAEIRRLVASYLPATELARTILERGGVPRSAIEVLPGAVDGLGAETDAVAAFVAHRAPRAVLFITARSHTARARFLLHRKLPPTTRVIVRSAPRDAFAPATWWRRRGDSREVMSEYLRWFNTLVLRDPWRQRRDRAAA